MFINCISSNRKTLTPEKVLNFKINYSIIGKNTTYRIVIWRHFHQHYMQLLATTTKTTKKQNLLPIPHSTIFHVCLVTPVCKIATVVWVATQPGCIHSSSILKISMETVKKIKHGMRASIRLYWKRCETKTFPDFFSFDSIYGHLCYYIQSLMSTSHHFLGWSRQACANTSLDTCIMPRFFSKPKKNWNFFLL